MARVAGRAWPCTSHVSQLLLILLLSRALAVAAQPYSCSAGTVAYIRCYVDDEGYISDIQYRNTPFQTIGSSTVCQSTQQQLSAIKPSDIYIATGEFVAAIAVCKDASGVCGLVFSTSLGQSYSCGSQVTGCAVQQGTSALGGFAASCSSSSNGLKRVLDIEDICWTPNYNPPTTPNGCAPGQGSPGGGIPCKPCVAGEYGDGDSGMCMPCPPGAFTLQDAQSSCGCLPGYGTTTDNPNECRECPAGTFSLGGSLQPCTKCPDGFDSVPGAPSARFCVCKAGYGAADGTCTACAKGYYNPGVLVQKIAGKDGVAPATNITLQKQGLMSPGLRALVLAVQEAQDSGTAPTNNKCTFCGAGFTTTSTGATSSRACGGSGNSTSDCQGANQELVDDICVCSAGYEPAKDGSGDCSLCRSRFFKADAGDTACTACPAGQVATDDRTACVGSGSSPPPPPVSSPSPTPDNTQGECKNACVDCDIASFVDDITATCADAPGSLVGANIYCQAKNTGNPLFTATPASVLLDGSTGDFDCTEMGKVSSFEFTVTDTGDCKNQPLTCKVSGYTAG